MKRMKDDGARLRLRGGWILRVWPRQLFADRTLAVWSYAGTIVRVAPAALA